MNRRDQKTKHRSSGFDSNGGKVVPAPPGTNARGKAVVIQSPAAGTNVGSAKPQDLGRRLHELPAIATHRRLRTSAVEPGSSKPGGGGCGGHVPSKGVIGCAKQWNDFHIDSSQLSIQFGSRRGKIQKKTRISYSRTKICKILGTNPGPDPLD